MKDDLTKEENKNSKSCKLLANQKAIYLNDIINKKYDNYAIREVNTYEDSIKIVEEVVFKKKKMKTDSLKKPFFINLQGSVLSA